MVRTYTHTWCTSFVCASELMLSLVLTLRKGHELTIQNQRSSDHPIMQLVKKICTTYASTYVSNGMHNELSSHALLGIACTSLT